MLFFLSLTEDSLPENHENCKHKSHLFKESFFYNLMLLRDIGTIIDIVFFIILLAWHDYCHREEV